MKRDELMWVLAKYFPRLFLPAAEFLQQEAAAIIIDRLLRIDREPLTCTQLNQLLHMADEAGVSDGFFKFYFLVCPEDHPYAVQELLVEPPELWHRFPAPNTLGTTPLFR